MKHATIEEFKGVHLGGRVIVLGNGPSLRRLPSECHSAHTIGVNRSWEVVCDSTYHCVGDLRHIKDLDADRWRTDVLFNWTGYVPERGVGVHVPMMHKPQGWGLPRGPNYFSYSGNRAIQLADWLGFSEVFLVGFDGGPRHHKAFTELHLVKTRAVLFNCSNEPVAGIEPASLDGLWLRT